MNTELIPAIMPESFDDIAVMTGLVRHDVSMVQLDLMDGNYVPEKTWPYVLNKIGRMVEIEGEDNGFPLWEEMNYELDLMVARPELRLDDWLATGASRIVFHYGSVHDWEPIRNLDPTIRSFVQIGLGIVISDNLEDIFALLDEDVFDYVQCMGIEHIGYQGEPFNEQILPVISAIKERYPDMNISVDGGVSLASIAILKDAGANRFVSGSGVYGGGDVTGNIVELNNVIHPQ